MDNWGQPSFLVLWKVKYKNENAVVKVICFANVNLSNSEKELLKPFRKLRVEQAPVEENTRIAMQALIKKRKVVESDYLDLAFIPPTSNIVERLVSAARLVLTDYRKSMSPYVLCSWNVTEACGIALWSQK